MAGQPQPWVVVPGTPLRSCCESRTCTKSTLQRICLIKALPRVLILLY
ncbi:unnamed protein product [Gulo gulo]|uniref:Uncharacterized protein n=1 Tax=Gulo gulo TaxID=48420 RepID=A0A9X9M9S6_GULGU|nr:unnamed protein product [Gulo gulo]